MTRAANLAAAAALLSPAHLATEEILFTRSFTVSGEQDRMTRAVFGHDSRSRRASDAVERRGDEAAFRRLHRYPLQRGA